MKNFKWVLLFNFLLVSMIACGGSSSDQTSQNSSATENTASKSQTAQDKIGQVCTSDSNCNGGTCLDLSQVNDGCQGKVCTILCEKNADCPEVASFPDCDPGPNDAKVCLYGAWKKQFCKK